MSTRRNALSDIQLRNLDGKYPNAGLWLDSYLDDTDDSEKNSIHIHDVASIATPDMYTSFYARWKEQLKDSTATFREAEVKGRMIIGLGSESVLETAIALHRTYGVPYIPGSALKGLAAHYVREKLGEAWKKGTSPYKVLFGDTDESGCITFFDALYIPGTGFHEQALYPDVITVHHSKYYGNKALAPADWDSPTPISFLSATGKYLIALAAPALNAIPKQRQEWIDVTFNILEDALKTMGIGAKTSSGYGRVKLIAQPVDPELLRARNLVNEIERMPTASVASQISNYYQYWQKLNSQDARKLLAQAIVDKVRLAGREKASAGKDWYQNLLVFLGESGK